MRACGDKFVRYGSVIGLYRMLLGFAKTYWAEARFLDCSKRVARNCLRWGGHASSNAVCAMLCWSWAGLFLKLSRWVARSFFFLDYGWFVVLLIVPRLNLRLLVFRCGVAVSLLIGRHM